MRSPSLPAWPPDRWPSDPELPEPIIKNPLGGGFLDVVEPRWRVFWWRRSLLNNFLEPAWMLGLVSQVLLSYPHNYPRMSCVSRLLYVVCMQRYLSLLQRPEPHLVRRPIA
jgi:hypothetical protein